MNLHLSPMLHRPSRFLLHVDVGFVSRMISAALVGGGELFVHIPLATKMPEC